MYNPTKNEITFPHIIPGNKLADKEYSYNDINGGMTPIANLNLVQNSFFGGNIRQLGMVKDLGFYACPAFWGKQILGFYIHDPSTITEKGKELLESRFPNTTICYQAEDPNKNKDLTPEQRKEKEKLRKEALEKGLAAETITHTTVEELKTLIASFESGEVDEDNRLVSSVEDGSTEGYTKEFKQKQPVQKGRKPRVKTTS